MSTDVPTSRLRQALPWLWLTMSLLWAFVIIVTDQIAWPLALWIATTVGPLASLRTSANQSEPDGPVRKGSLE